MAKFKLIFRYLLIIVFNRPTMWKWEFEKLKREHNDRDI
jgi:hypothetical protein